VSHLHNPTLKDLIRGWVCIWFSCISLALQVMALELHLCLALPGITETNTVKYVSVCAYQSDCTKACTSRGGIVLCLLVVLPMSVAKEAVVPFLSFLVSSYCMRNIQPWCSLVTMISVLVSVLTTYSHLAPSLRKG
jgi:hypothetical protein